METIEHNLEAGKEFLSSYVETKEGKVECSLVRGATIFGFLIASKGVYDKYLPPVLGDDLFVQIKHPSIQTANIVEEVFESYLFELSSSTGVDLSPSPRPEYIEEQEQELDARKIDFTLRPLLISRGVSDLLVLYNRATRATDLEVELLYYTRVLEFVSQTVIRVQQTAIIQMKLASPRVLNPDAEYILELEALFDEQRVFKKDKEAIIIPRSIVAMRWSLQGARRRF